MTLSRDLRIRQTEANFNCFSKNPTTAVVVTCLKVHINATRLNWKIISSFNDMNCKLYLARLVQINYATLTSLYTTRALLSKYIAKFHLPVWESLVTLPMPAQGADSPEAALGRREQAPCVPQEWRFPRSTAMDRRCSSDRQEQLSRVLRMTALVFRNIPSFAGISEGVISLLVSSNPSSLSVPLLGRQEQIAEISTLCKSLVSPFLRGCHTGTVRRIWVICGYKDIKITIWS